MNTKKPLKANLVKSAFDRIKSRICPVCGQPVNFSELVRPGTPLALQVIISRRKEWVHVRHHGMQELAED